METPLAPTLPDLRNAHPKMRRLYQYWLERRGARDMPARADLDVLDIADITPYIFVVDVLDGGDDFRIRYYGTAFVELYGRDLTGHRVSTLPEQPWTSLIMQVYRRVALERSPAFDRVALSRRDVERYFADSTEGMSRDFAERLSIFAYERLILPLGSAEGTNMLLVATILLRNPNPDGV